MAPSSSYSMAKQRFPFIILCFLYIILSVVPSCNSQNTEGLCAKRFTNDLVEMCRPFRHLRLSMAYDYFQLSCCNGYKEIGRRNNFPQCQSVCKQPCIKGTCIKPDICDCNSGYYRKTKYECAPMCYPSCKNGVCMGVDDCTCNRGFRIKNGTKNECEPICQSNCMKGDCVAPGVCKCWEGYTMNKSTGLCEPVCDPPCVNSICSMPGLCRCSVGYERETNNSCRPTCPGGCSKGICSSPGICQCSEGNVFSETSRQCIPVCNGECLNGFCESPNVCKCNDGYRLEEKICKPVCNRSCVNSSCVAPDVCKCSIGFESVDDYTCRPVCPHGCGPGICVSPGQCLCPKGYNAVPGEPCTPTCKSCNDGYCIAPDKCICTEGYSLNIAGNCVLKCDKPCINSTCVFPNTCECKEGYKQVTDTICSPTCKQCTNAECIEPNICSCNPGFDPHPDDPTFCLPQLRFITSSQDSSTDTSPPTNNTFHHVLPSALRILEDNATYFFQTTPKLSIPASCSYLFQNNNITSESRNLTGRLSCEHRMNAQSTDIHIYCESPLLKEESNLDEPFYNATSIYNISSIDSFPRNLMFSLIFPEEFSPTTNNSCTICIFSTSESGYFNINEDLLFTVHSCFDEAEKDDLTLIFEDITSLLCLGLVAALPLSFLGVIIIWIKIRRKRVHQISSTPKNELDIVGGDSAPSFTAIKWQLNLNEDELA